MSGWGKNGLPTFSPSPKKQRLFAYSCQGKIDTFTSRGGERMCPVFLHPDNHLHKVYALSCQGGDRMSWPSFSPPSKKQMLYVYSWQGRLMLSFVRVGKEWTSLVFLHPDNHLHKVDALSSQDGERMGWPSFSPPPKKQRLFAYSWLGKVDTFTRWVGEKMGWSSFSPPR